MAFNHKLINDLAWAICSPGLLDGYTGNELPAGKEIITTNWSKNRLDQYSNLLTEQDKIPALIQQYMVNNTHDYRLGNYFENLVAYWFEINPDFHLLERNLVVTSTEKKTLGEFDLIIDDLRNHQTTHLEVAVKFYLEVKAGHRTYWFGPNTMDRLDIKLDRILNHQVILSENPDVKKILSGKNIIIDKKRVLLKGRLFSRSDNANTGNCWMTLEEFSDRERSINGTGSRWLILDKTWWLAEIEDAGSHFLTNALLTRQQVINKLHHDEFSRPICVARICDNKEMNRLFITPDNWQEEALARLR